MVKNHLQMALGAEMCHD